MEDILDKILKQLTRIADCYENKERREINIAINNNRQTMKKKVDANNIKK